MSRWARDTFGEPLPPPLQATVSVERQLLARLEDVRAALVEEAEAGRWDGAAVDRILAAGSLEPITREYVVQFTEEVNREVRVRATSKEQASEIANGNGGRLVGVREAVE